MNTIADTHDVKLTPRQKAFISAYLVCRCAAKAARKAGYSPKGAKVTGCRLLTNVNLQAELAAQQTKMSEKLELDRNTVIGGIFSGIAQARTLSDASGIIRGWVALSRICGLDKPEATKSLVLSTANLALEARLSQLSDAELLAIAEGRAIPL